MLVDNPHASRKQTHITSLIQVIDCRFNWLIWLLPVSRRLHWLLCLQTSAFVLRRQRAFDIRGLGGGYGCRCWRLSRTLFGRNSHIKLILYRLLRKLWFEETIWMYVHRNNRRKIKRKLKNAAITGWKYIILVQGRLRWKLSFSWKLYFHYKVTAKWRRYFGYQKRISSRNIPRSAFMKARKKLLPKEFVAI